MKGLIGKKVGMTSMFDDYGRNIAVTVIEVEPCVVTQIKNEEKDGYQAVQVGAFDKKEKSTKKPLVGHFAKANTSPKKYVREFSGISAEGIELGDKLKLEDVFQEGDEVDVVGVSKGKGFTGVMKRHNFGGVGDATHGQHKTPRASGSIGGASDPSRVFKGKKMAGRTGGNRAKNKNLKIAKILSESNILLVTGSVPGPNGGYVEVTTGN